MADLRLNAHIIELANDTLLVLAPHNGEWLISHCAFKNVLNLLDGNHTPAEIVDKNPELSESSIEELLEALRQADMLSPESPLSQNAVCDGGSFQSSTPAHVVMNLTEQCNLKCLYCYVGSGPSKTNYMSKETAVCVASEMLRLNADNDQKITFVFHGGEPTLNLDTVEAMCEFLAPHRDRVVFQLQTNAANVTDRFISLVKKYDIQLGISIDGVGEVHDATRICGNGKGSFDRVAEGIARLQAEKISFGALTVLNRNNYRHIPELMDYLAEHGINSAAFLRLLEAGREDEHPELLLNGDEVFECYQEILDWLIAYNSAHNKAFEERTISNIVKIIATGRRDYMCMRKPCGAGRNTLGVDTEGDVYPCDNLIGEPGLCMGNLTEQSLKSMVESSPVVKRLDQTIAEKTAECQSCVWESICCGVCSAQCYLSGHSSAAEEAECAFLRKMIPELFRRYVEDPSVFKLLCRDMRPRNQKRFYFNLLFNCNSHCIFCAADHDLYPKSEIITLDMMRNLIQYHGMLPGDSVILNGGELTLHPEIVEMVELLSSHGLNLVLSTNGRRLSDDKFCKALAQAGAQYYAIPFFGCDAETHDYCTGAPGSFDDTVAGVDNLIRFREELGLDFLIEIKLLSIKNLLDENPKVLEWVAQTFPKVDVISINALLVSDTVLTRQDELIPDFASWSESVNQAIAVAKRCGVTDKIRLNDTPLCLLDSCHYDLLDRLLEDQRPLLPKDKLYIDHANLNGRESEEFSAEVQKSCGDCALYHQCEFVNKLYGNPEVAKASLKMLS